MPRVSSTTGLIAARVRRVCKPEPKKIELIGSSKPAPFTLRPFAGLFNPFPYGCSVLCNHPADGEAKEFVRRAKESWATEGKALLLPAEMEMIRATLLAGGVDPDGPGGTEGNAPNVEATTTVPEELFRKYTETDSRPLTPAPTLASGPLTAHRLSNDEQPATCNPRERTTLILDLRTSSQEQDNETLSWHALTLERQPTPRRSEITRPSVAQHQTRPIVPPPPSPALPVIELSDQGSSKNDEGDDNSDSDDELPMRRRGKRLRKRKCRRGSTYGQQNEVRDPPEPPETQVSQVDDESRRNSAFVATGEATEVKTPPPEKQTIQIQERIFPSSFISPEILKHLSRELDRDLIEEEFSLRRRLALEEAWRVRGEFHSVNRGPRQSTNIQVPLQNTPRMFSRQSARFEILDSASLADLTPLSYLGKHVSLTSGRKLIYGRAFSRYYEEGMDGLRIIQANDVNDGLDEILGKPMREDEKLRLTEAIGPIVESLNFRTWCGLCAAVERLIAPLPSRDIDPPEWLERADFGALERRIRSIDIDPTLARLLREIRDR
ncbi:uncharacterized protein [Venturia canescens]|uniref:uncharacterized protein n=1 Tax=Venturia canescens TaxID=32260 RepID=UPI001C9C7F36|nr:uncharacterized protein LOC122409010 [Venturia canescens]